MYFFSPGGQIDGQGNVNLVSTGDYAHPDVRFPGSFCSAYLYYVVRKIILFRTEHSRRTLGLRSTSLVHQVQAHRIPIDPAGCRAGDQPLSVQFCKRAFHARKRAPGHTVEEIVENTGFNFEMPAIVPETSSPSPESLNFPRGDRATIVGGLSAIRNAGLRCYQSAFAS